MLKISHLARALELERHLGNPSDADIVPDNNSGKPNLPGTRAARILEAQKNQFNKDKQVNLSPNNNG